MPFGRGSTVGGETEGSIAREEETNREQRELGMQYILFKICLELGFCHYQKNPDQYSPLDTLSLSTTLCDGINNPYFIDEEIEAQRGKLTCPKPHSL